MKRLGFARDLSGEYAQHLYGTDSDSGHQQSTLSIRQPCSQQAAHDKMGQRFVAALPNDGVHRHKWPRNGN